MAILQICLARDEKDDGIVEIERRHSYMDKQVMNDLVSIVMLSDKNGQYLIETIRSVQAQTYENWELLYVDDSQKVDYLNVVLKEKEADSRIKVSAFVFKNGPARARTTAIREANGRWIAFIDAGDLWEPTKLERQIAFMKDHCYAVSYTKYGIIDRIGKRKGLVISGPECIARAVMMKCYWSQLLTVMYDSEKIGKLSIPNLIENNGYAIMLLLAKKADCHLLDECLAIQRAEKGKFNRVPIPLNFYWRYAAYRVVAGCSKIGAIARTFVNIYYTLVKRIKYVERLKAGN